MPADAPLETGYDLACPADPLVPRGFGRSGTPVPNLLTKNERSKEVTPQRCPRVGFDVVNLTTRERFPGTCKVYRCPWCGPAKARAYGQMAAASRPERFVTLTLAGDSWQDCRAHMHDFIQRVRRHQYDWQAFWAVEPNPRGTGHHVHALQHGDYIPQHELQDAWRAIVHIEAINAHVETVGRTARYVIKGTTAANYVTKGTTTDLADHVALNGGRTAHWSRRYMRLANDDPVAAYALRAALGRAPQLGPWLRVGRLEDDVQVADQLERIADLARRTRSA